MEFFSRCKFSFFSRDPAADVTSCPMPKKLARCTLDNRAKSYVKARALWDGTPRVTRMMGGLLIVHVRLCWEYVGCYRDGERDGEGGVGREGEGGDRVI